MGGGGASPLEQVLIPDSTFLDAVRYLNSTYGLFEDRLLMFGDTFSCKKEFRITSLNKIKSDTIKVIFLPTGYPKQEKISEKIYHTYQPIQVANKISSISYKFPKKIDMLTTPENVLYKTESICVADELKKLKSTKSTKQFYKELFIDKHSLHATNDSNIGIKSMIHTMGTETIKPEIFNVPKPLKLSHWKIGNKIKYSTMQTAYKDYDLNFVVLGILYQIRKDTTGIFICDIFTKLGAQSLIT